MHINFFVLTLSLIIFSTTCLDLFKKTRPQSCLPFFPPAFSMALAQIFFDDVEAVAMQRELHAGFADSGFQQRHGGEPKKPGSLEVSRVAT